MRSRWGSPSDKLICASNDNKVLYDFFTTGIYDRRREFILTNSPSMDILISSNLERLIYLSTGCDGEKTGRLMKELSEKGMYEITGDMKERMADFVGGFATQEENGAEIKKVYEDTGYLIDTHTGVALPVYTEITRRPPATRKDGHRVHSQSVQVLPQCGGGHSRDREDWTTMSLTYIDASEASFPAWLFPRRWRRSAGAPVRHHHGV